MQLPLILLLEFFPIWEKIDPQHKKSDHKEGWAPKNWCFWIVLLEKTLQSPLDSKEIKSILKGINPEYSLEGLMLKLKLQYFGHLMWRADSFLMSHWERLKAGGEGDDRGRDGCLESLTQWTWVWANSRRWWGTGKPSVLRSMESQRAGHAERQNNKTCQS